MFFLLTTIVHCFYNIGTIRKEENMPIKEKKRHKAYTKKQKELIKKANNALKGTFRIMSMARQSDTIKSMWNSLRRQGLKKKDIIDHINKTKTIIDKYDIDNIGNYELKRDREMASHVNIILPVYISWAKGYIENTGKIYHALDKAIDKDFLFHLTLSFRRTS